MSQTVHCATMGDPVEPERMLKCFEQYIVPHWATLLNQRGHKVSQTVHFATMGNPVEPERMLKCLIQYIVPQWVTLLNQRGC